MFGFGTHTKNLFVNLRKTLVKRRVRISAFSLRVKNFCFKSFEPVVSRVTDPLCSKVDTLVLNVYVVEISIYHILIIGNYSSR